MTSTVNCETVADFGSSQLRASSERKDEHFMPDDPVLIASTIRFEATFTVSHHSAGARGFPVASVNNMERLRESRPSTIDSHRQMSCSTPTMVRRFSASGLGLRACG